MQENLRTEAGLSYRHLFPPSQICSTIINGAKAALRENVHGKPALPGLIIRGTGVTRATTTHACRLPDYLDVAARNAAHSYERAFAQFSFFEENVAQPPRRLVGGGNGEVKMYAKRYGTQSHRIEADWRSLSPATGMEPFPSRSRG